MFGPRSLKAKKGRVFAAKSCFRAVAAHLRRGAATAQNCTKVASTRTFALVKI
jgi:hypothetical protein